MCVNASLGKIDGQHTRETQAGQGVGAALQGIARHTAQRVVRDVQILQAQSFFTPAHRPVCEEVPGKDQPLQLGEG